jgi:hypothetical protein
MEHLIPIIRTNRLLRLSRDGNTNCHAHSHSDRDANGDAWWPSHSFTAASSNAGASARKALS